MNNFNPYSPITPRDLEIKIGINTNFYIKLNDKEHIDYINHDFCNITGYEDFELIDENLLAFWHPDMPMIIHDMVMESVNQKEKVELIIKILAKDGRYCWTHTIIDAKINDYGEIVGYYIHCKAVSQPATKEIASLYYILKKIEEKTNNTKVARRYVIGYLEDRKQTLTSYFQNLIKKYPVEEQFTSYPNNPKYPTYSQNPGSFDVHSNQKQMNQAPVQEVKKSLFQRIFGSKS